MYAPFGEIIEATNGGGAANGLAAHRRRLNDKYVDEVSGLSYYGFRYYDRLSMTWTQADPLFSRAPELASGGSRRALLYTFSLNNSMRYIDPDGLDSKQRTGSHGGLGGMGVQDTPENPCPENAMCGFGDWLGEKWRRARKIERAAFSFAWRHKKALAFGAAVLAVSYVCLPCGVVLGGSQARTEGEALFAVAGGGLGGAARGVRSTTAAVAENTVSVFHGSIRDGARILETGLDPRRAPTFVSRDLAAAKDALTNHPDAVHGLGTIIESRIPVGQFESTLAPLERSYSGFYPYKLQSSEITLRAPEQIELFNQYIVK